MRSGTRTSLPISYENAGARLCFATADLADTVATLVGGALERVVAAPGKEYEKLLASEPSSLVAREADDSAWLFYTSGTPGKPIDSRII